MMRIVRRSAAVAAGFAGIVLAFGPAQASTPPANSPICAAPTASGGARLTCRSARLARRPVRHSRRLIVDARITAADPAYFGPGRYVSLLILGVGF